MKKLKEEKGSITLFVVVSMLFFVLLLAGMYMLSSAKEQTGISETAKIKEIYEKDVNQIDNIYETLTNELIYYVKDKDGNAIPVPKGFSPITTNDQGTKQTGFVIKNDKDKNEFVWVPVKGMDYYYDRDTFLSRQPFDGKDVKTNSIKIKYDITSSYYFTEAMPNIRRDRTELDSINQYEGFYIGRYEVGKDNEMPVVQQGYKVWNFIKRDTAKQMAEEMYRENDAVISRLCSSYAWDTTLKFIKTKYPDYPTNTTQGNYQDTVFEYIDLDNTKKTKEKGAMIILPTGQTTKVNNIYDMGGNVWEWTTEDCSNPSDLLYTIRGGCFNNNSSEYPASNRYVYNINAAASDGIGFRITLFL